MKLSLASAFAVIATEGQHLESRADSVLKIVKTLKLKDLKSFGKAVRQAYKANGWNGKPGKPKAGAEKLKPVPTTVKQYVSAIRGALRLELPVLSYSSFYALRQDLKEKRAKARKPKRIAPEMIGISVRRPDELNGAPFHDLVALYHALDRARKPRMLAALDRVKRDFSHAAPQLVLAASNGSGQEMRKAA